MTSHDTNGREYARYDDLKDCEYIELDDGFPCRDYVKYYGGRNPKKALCLFDSEGRKFFTCVHGMHYLDGQDDGDGYCVGVYRCQ